MERQSVHVREVKAALITGSAVMEDLTVQTDLMKLMNSVKVWQCSYYLTKSLTEILAILRH